MPTEYHIPTGDAAIETALRTGLKSLTTALTALDEARAQAREIEALRAEMVALRAELGLPATHRNSHHG